MEKQMLASLNRQRLDNVKARSSAQVAMSSLDADIQRLQEASIALANEISNLNSVCARILNLNADEGSWKGIKRNEFVQRYDEYKSNVRLLLTELREKSDQLDDEISQALLTKSIYVDSVAVYSSRISRLDAQIEQVKRSEK